MDDPTRGIDVAAKAEVYSLVRALADEGIAILLSSSEVDEVLDLSDRILIMRQGTIIKEFDRRGVRKADVMLYTSGDPAIRDRD
jgi:ABC-type sugar transport system ATPase subunit